MTELTRGDVAALESCLGARIRGVRTLRPAPVTTYAMRRLQLDLTDGRRLDVLCKDYRDSPHPVDVALDRGRRECHVYEHVLSRLGLGTPALHGVVWGDGGRHWLLLEFVEGRLLDHELEEDRLAAARWLGWLRAGVAGDLDRLAQPGLLLRYDAAELRGTAERAVEAVGSRFGSLRPRLVRAVAGYEEVIEAICAAEPTLVHGSYRHHNIIVRTSPQARPCPTDWEWAGLGPPLLDLAFVADGYAQPWVEQMCTEYARAADVPAEGMVEVVVKLRLHKALRSLARSSDWDYSERVVTKLVVRAETIAEGLRRAPR